jgi:hypothetical protein
VREKLIMVVVALVLLAAAGAYAYTSSVPTELTGAPGEGTCANCHDNLNSGPGGASITAPAQYQAGETINVTVDVYHAGQEKWGFELTALDDSNQPVGSFTLLDTDRTQLDIDGGTGREYVMHTEVGTDTGVLNASPGWTFQWVAPAGRPSVTFYVATVAANDGQGTNGDYVYTATHSSSLTQTGLADPDVASWGRIKELYR